jgi:SPP1 family predicted phage head-tail adaptor
MGIGQMDKKIILQKPVKVTDGQGGRKPSYETVTSVWAEFIRPSIQTVESAGTIVSEMLRKMIIWKRSDVRRGWQVLFGNRTFSVEHSYDDDNPLKMVLVCKEVVR